MRLIEVLAPSEVLRLPIPQVYGTRYVPVLVNPAKDDLWALVDSLHPDNRDQRIRGVEIDGDYYFFDGHAGTHDAIGSYLDLFLKKPRHPLHRIAIWPTRHGFGVETYDSPGYVRDHLERLLGRRPRDPHFEFGYDDASP